MTSPVFVVGTGRCGSTMISSLLRKHPDVLSLSELFGAITDLGTLIPHAFPTGVINASQFWNILSTPYHKENLLIRHELLRTKNISHSTLEAGIPAIMMETLPHLTYNADTLFEEAQAFVTSQTPALIHQHYLRFFLWLQHHFKRQAWVERSGGSLRFIHLLTDTFPDAKFIHIVRDGRNTAISMSKHPSFRMALLTLQFIEKLGIDPFESEDRSSIGELSDELRHLLPESFTASAFRNYHLPLSFYGRYWSREIINGLHMLEKLPAERVLTIRYEDFQEDTEVTVKNLIAFIDPSFVDEDWINNVVPLVSSARSSWRNLPAQEQEELNTACLPGIAALEALQVSYI